MRVLCSLPPPPAPPSAPVYQSFPPPQLQEGVRYVVSLKVAKGDRSAAASRSFTPGSSQQGLSAELRRSCGVDLLTGAHLPCPPLHNPTDPLTLIALPEFDAPFDMDVSAEGS